MSLVVDVGLEVTVEGSEVIVEGSEFSLAPSSGLCFFFFFFSFGFFFGGSGVLKDG